MRDRSTLKSWPELSYTFNDSFSKNTFNYLKEYQYKQN